MGNEHCAASEEYCTKTTIAEKMISMAAPKKIVKQDCPGTECPAGCCPNVGWYCCPGDEYCAASEEYCKRVSIAEKLISMAAPKKIVKQDCPGTECPGGCCPNVGWYCCPGDEYCAASEEYCKKTNIAEKLMSMAAPKNYLQEVKQDCPGTVCPAGCCPNVGWFCCSDNEHCAASEEYCKKTNYAEKLSGMAVGPCGVEFREAFSCFHYSKEEPKGADCIEAFQAMQDCMKGYPELYEKETQSVNLSELDSDDKVQDEEIKEENKNISASDESSATNIEQSNSNDSSNDSPIVSSAQLKDAVQSDNESSALSDQLPPSSETEAEPLKQTSEDDIEPKSIDSSEDCDDNDKEAVKIES